jgi:hypothetical protein
MTTWIGHVGRTSGGTHGARSILIGKAPLGDLGTDTTLLLKCILKKNGYEDEVWIYLAQGRIKRWVPVKPVMNF